ncbi:hypothetical protein SLS54_007955 [Diplodia seriata]
MIPRMAGVRPAPSLFVLTPLQRACRRASSLPTVQPFRYVEKANAPSTTLPADLDVPARRPDQNLLSYGYHSGKAYWQFYKQGVKNVWNNRKEANEVRQRHKNNKSAALGPDMDASRLSFTRREYQLLRRSKHDMRRVPAFALLLMVFGEWLPVFVIFVNAIVPLPCRIPRQIERSERNREAQRLHGRTLLFDAQQRQGLRSQHVAPHDKQLRALDTMQINLATAAKDLVEHNKTSLPVYLNHAFANFNLRSPLWDRTGAYAVVPWLLWKIKLRSHLTYMVVDDALLLRDGGVGALHPKNVFEACTERGINIVDEDGQFRKDRELRADLEKWLKEKRSRAWLELFIQKKA